VFRSGARIAELAPKNRIQVSLAESGRGLLGEATGDQNGSVSTVRSKWRLEQIFLNELGRLYPRECVEPHGDTCMPAVRPHRINLTVRDVVTLNRVFSSDSA
jgi:hypothetical protein